MSSDFYAYLHSEYKGCSTSNEANEFRVNFERAIELDGDYSVALAQCFYDSYINTFMNESIVIQKVESYIETFSEERIPFTIGPITIRDYYAYVDKNKFGSASIIKVKHDQCLYIEKDENNLKIIKNVALSPNLASRFSPIDDSSHIYGTDRYSLFIKKNVRDKVVEINNWEKFKIASQNWKKDKEDIYSSVDYATVTATTLRTIYLGNKRFSTIKQVADFLSKKLAPLTFTPVQQKLKISNFINDKYILSLKLNNGVHITLGFESDKFNKDVVSSFPVQLKRNTQTMYIYSDIVEPTRVSNSYTTLLSVLPYVADDSMVTFNSQVPQYIRVSKSSISSINIIIKDEIGMPFPFVENAKCMIVLHFHKI